MTKNEILLDIAIRKLGIETLESRSAKCELPVSWIKNALEEAFNSGMEFQADIENER